LAGPCKFKGEFEYLLKRNNLDNPQTKPKPKISGFAQPLQ